MKEDTFSLYFDLKVFVYHLVFIKCGDLSINSTLYILISILCCNTCSTSSPSITTVPAALSKLKYGTSLMTSKLFLPLSWTFFVPHLLFLSDFECTGRHANFFCFIDEFGEVGFVHHFPQLLAHVVQSIPHLSFYFAVVTIIKLSDTRGGWAIYKGC